MTSRTLPLPSEAPAEEPSPEVSGERPWIGRDPKTKRLLPGYPGPAYKGVGRTKLERAEQIVKANKPLEDYRNTIAGGGPDALRAIVQQLATSLTLLGHFKNALGTQALIDGVTTAKGYTRSSVTMTARLIDQEARLSKDMVALLGIDPSKPDTASSAPRLDALLSGLTDDELATVKAVFERAAERKANGEQPEALPIKPDETIIELPDEDVDVG